MTYFLSRYFLKHFVHFMYFFVALLSFLVSVRIWNFGCCNSDSVVDCNRLFGHRFVAISIYNTYLLQKNYGQVFVGWMLRFPRVSIALLGEMRFGLDCAVSQSRKSSGCFPTIRLWRNYNMEYSFRFNLSFFLKEFPTKNSVKQTSTYFNFGR